MNWLIQLDQGIISWVSEKHFQSYSAKELQEEKQFWEDTLQAWIQYFPMGVACFFGWHVFLFALAISVVLYFLRRELLRAGTSV